MRLESFKRLEDARMACVRIGSFLLGVSRAQFVESDLLRSAVERQVEIIGEALGRAAAADPEIERRIPELRKIVGMRNRLIHGYDEVDYNIVWDVVARNVPELRRRRGEAQPPGPWSLIRPSPLGTAKQNLRMHFPGPGS